MPRVPQWVQWLGRIVLVVVAILVIWRLWGVVVTILLALLIMAALRPMVLFLGRHHVPHLLAIFLCYAALAGVGAGLVAYIIPAGAEQAQQFSSEVQAFAHGVSSFRVWWDQARTSLPFLPRFESLPGALSASTSVIAGGVMGVVKHALSWFVQFISVLLLSFFFLLEGDKILAEVLRLFPHRIRHDAPPLLHHMADDVGLYALGQFVEMCIVGVLDGVGMFLLGVHFPVLLGVLAGLSDVIPYFGPIIAVVPAVLIALSQSFWLALYATGVYVGVHSLEANFLNPYVVGRFVGLRPVWVVVAVLIGEAVMGIPGMALAVPAATVVRIVIRDLYLPWLRRTTGTRSGA